MEELRGTFEDAVIAFDRPSRMTGPGRIVATREGLKIEGSRRAGWPAPTLGCLAPVLLFVGTVALGTAMSGAAQGLGRLAGLAIIPSIVVAWFIGHTIAPRRAVEQLVPWDALESGRRWGQRVSFRVASGELRGLVTFAADGGDPAALESLVRRVKQKRWDSE